MLKMLLIEQLQESESMPIIRKTADSIDPIHASFCTDPALSSAARLAATYMCFAARFDRQILSLEELQKLTGAGRRAWATARKQLLDGGYVKMEGDRELWDAVVLGINSR